jgi:D-alanyl-D-alanine carboxypeptidase
MPRVVNHGPGPIRKPGVPDPNPTTNHVIVVDGESGEILFQRNADERVAPASLTKIMTAIVAIERGNPSDHVRIDVDARQMPGDSLMGLQPGFDVTFQDLLYGLLLPSGDDAALAIGRYIAGSDAKFVELMNEKARWLGLNNTHFADPHGLDAPDHYSSPADMVEMARYAMQYPEFRQIVRSKSYDIQESNISYTIFNVNPLLGEYPGLDGVKTGFTDDAGKALVATAVRNGHRVYVAYMRSQDGAMADGTLLLDWAFDSFIWPQDTPGSPAG